MYYIYPLLNWVLQIWMDFGTTERVQWRKKYCISMKGKDNNYVSLWLQSYNWVIHWSTHLTTTTNQRWVRNKAIYRIADAYNTGLQKRDHVFKSQLFYDYAHTKCVLFNFSFTPWCNVCCIFDWHQVLQPLKSEFTLKTPSNMSTVSIF